MKKLFCNYWAFLLIVGLSILFQILETNTSFKLHYEREFFYDAFYSQWITPSLVHLNWRHWLLNILNLWALVVIFSTILYAQKLLYFFISSSLAIMLSLHFLSLEVHYYAGMSGVIYGLSVYASVIAVIKKEKIVLGTLLLAYIFLKLVADDVVNHYMGIDKILENMKIITDVHWYGAIWGLFYALVEVKYQGIWMKQSKGYFIAKQ